MEMHSERRLIIWILVESIEDILYGTSQIVACHTADGHKRLEVDVPLQTRIAVAMTPNSEGWIFSFFNCSHGGPASGGQLRAQISNLTRLILLSFSRFFVIGTLKFARLHSQIYWDTLPKDRRTETYSSLD